MNITLNIETLIDKIIIVPTVENFEEELKTKVKNAILAAVADSKVEYQDSSKYDLDKSQQP